MTVLVVVEVDEEAPRWGVGWLEKAPPPFGNLRNVKKFRISDT